MTTKSTTFATVVATLAMAGGAQADEIGTLQKGIVTAFTGYEGISEPFYFDVDIAAENTALVIGNALGKDISLGLATGRTQAGIVESLEQTGVSDRTGLYRLRLAPEMVKLRYEERSRTFYELSTTEIINLVLDEMNLQPIISTSASYEPHEVAIQHRESNLNFVARLLETDGIHYHFRQGGAALVIGDQNNVFPLLSGAFSYSSNPDKGVYSFSRGEKLQATRIETGDFNWKTPGNAILGSSQVSKSYGELRADAFPFGAKNNAEAQIQANVLIDQENSQAERCYGASSYAQLSAGYRFKLSGHPRADFNTTYLITAIKHVKDAAGYRNEFTCQPFAVKYRKRQTTPRPMISGVVSALVVGPSGQTNYVDEFGRVKVRFPWRRAGMSSNDFGDAGWVRVVQIGSGTGTSALWLPEVGDEVAVAFENGDVDRPVVLGNLFNAVDEPPLALPDNKDTSVFRFDSASEVTTQLEFRNKAGQERLLVTSGSNVIELDVASEKISIQTDTSSVTLDQEKQSIELNAGGSKLTLDPKGIRSNKTISMP